MLPVLDGRVHPIVTRIAQGDQVPYIIGTTLASEPDVMNMQVRPEPTVATFPPIPAQHSVTQCVVVVVLQPFSHDIRTPQEPQVHRCS